MLGDLLGLDPVFKFFWNDTVAMMHILLTVLVGWVDGWMDCTISHLGRKNRLTKLTYGK